MSNENQSPEVETKINTSNVHSKFYWSIGVILILIGLGNISGNIILGIIFIAFGVFLIPPFNKKLKEKYKFLHKVTTKKMAIGFFVVLFLCLISYISNSVESIGPNDTPVIKEAVAPTTPKVPVGETKTTDNKSTSTAQTKAPTNSTSKVQAQKDLDDIMSLMIRAHVVKSYEFSNSANVVYVDYVWYSQDVTFKKDCLAKIAMLKDAITGYRHFEMRDAYSNELVAEVTAFSSSLEVYR